MIVKETNSYAKHVLGDEKFSKWRKMDVVELKALLGFKILLAINNLPSIDDYWKRDPLLRYSPVADRISRDRFRELSRYLHFVDNNTLVPRGSPGHDRLGKVRPLIDHFAYADGIYYACGTARKDRKGFPEMLKKAKLPDRYARACKCTRAMGEGRGVRQMG